MEPKITVNLDDLLEHGSVVKAIRALCPDDMMLADSSAMGGLTFCTSGPGPGWTRRFDADDYARAAIREDVANSGCRPSQSIAIDPEDGRVAWGRDEYDDDGSWSDIIEWTDESCVCAECPTVEEAIEHPALTAVLARAAIGEHRPCSALDDWVALIRSIRSAAEELEEIELPDSEG